MGAETGRDGAGRVFDLTGRVAVVTGGNRGIGLGYAAGLVKAGAAVVVWGRNAEKNRVAVQQLVDLGGGPAHAVECDVGDPEQIRAAMATTLAGCGRVDSFFANAGGELARPFLEWTLDEWERVLRIDLTSVFLCFQEAARHMVSRGGGGKLVVTTSVGTVFGMPTRPAYSAAKAGCEALMRSLAVELAHHDIQVNAVQPGWVETPFVAPYKQDDASNRAIEQRTPARRWGQPRDLEGIAVYLTSDASRFHTGDTIRIDGGYAVM